MCAHFVDMVTPVKTQVVNGMEKLFDFQGDIIYISDQAFFVWTNMRLYDEEGERKFDQTTYINTEARRMFLSFMVIFHP